MDKIEELEKYKKLLDDGAITEDEFRLMKQKILGLKTDDEKAAEKQAEREQALAEIEKMREEKRRAQEEVQAREAAERQRQAAEQNRIIQEERNRQEAARQAEQARINQMQLQQAYNEEKAKEAARLDAARAQEMKIRQERNQKMQGTAKTAASVLKTVLLWIVTVFLILYTLGAFGTGGIKYVLSGIDSLLLAVLCCPLITKKVKSIPKVEQYYGIKKIITIVLVILFFVIIIV